VNAGAAKVMDYLRLMRLPNVFTAWADVTMGYLFVHHVLGPWHVFAWLAAASGCVYTAGMILNDVWDCERDRHERPERPLPAGRIAPAAARRWGWGLLAVGVVCGWMAGLTAGPLPWRSGTVVTLLAACVLLYDGGLKLLVLGPLGMGACRFLNVLLGMSTGPAWPAEPSLLGYGPPHLVAAGGIGVYIVGVTWFARREARTSRRLALTGACAVLLGGVALLGVLPTVLPPALTGRFVPAHSWLLLLSVLGLVIARRCVLAILDPSPQRVRDAVRNCLWSLIVLDAAVALLVSPPGWSLLIVTYLLPTVVLGQWIEST
jgi:4-hydroxybenzoate polyprenyltransferase